MIVFVNDKAEIHDVGTTNDPTLTGLFIKDEGNPFADWSKDKICCYRVNVTDGRVTMYTPYITSSVIPAIDRLGHEIDKITPYEATKTVSYGDTEIMFENVPQGNLTILVKDSEGNYPVHHATRKDDVVKVEFAPLEYAADVTITIQ